MLNVKYLILLVNFPHDICSGYTTKIWFLKTRTSHIGGIKMMSLHGLCSKNIWLCWRNFWSVVYLASLAAVPSLWLFIVILYTDFPKGLKQNIYEKYSPFKVSWWWCIELHLVNSPSSTFIRIIKFRGLHVSPSSDGDLIVLVVLAAVTGSPVLAAGTF